MDPYYQGGSYPQGQQYYDQGPGPSYGSPPYYSRQQYGQQYSPQPQSPADPTGGAQMMNQYGNAGTSGWVGSPGQYPTPRYSPYSDISQSILRPPGSYELGMGTGQVVFDEENVRRTFHPPDKDYGFMIVDEPKTPYTFDYIPNDPRGKLDTNELLRRMQLEQAVQYPGTVLDTLPDKPVIPGIPKTRGRDPRWPS